MMPSGGPADRRKCPRRLEIKSEIKKRQKQNRKKPDSGVRCEARNRWRPAAALPWYSAVVVSEISIGRFFFWGGGGTTEEQSSPPTAPDLDRKPTEFLRVSFPFYGFINWTVGRDDLRFDSTRVDQYCVFNGNLTVTKGTLKISRPISEISIKYQKKLY